MSSAKDADGQVARPEVEELADRLYLTTVHLLRRIRRADDQLELSAAQLSALTRVVAMGPTTSTELAAAEGVKPPTMTRLVQRLERGGYVVRRPDPEDGRATRIRHTPQGFKALESGRANRVEMFAGELAALPRSDRTKLRAALDVLDKLSRDPAS